MVLWAAMLDGPKAGPSVCPSRQGELPAIGWCLAFCGCRTPAPAASRRLPAFCCLPPTVGRRGDTGGGDSEPSVGAAETAGSARGCPRSGTALLRGRPRSKTPLCSSCDALLCEVDLMVPGG